MPLLYGGRVSGGVAITSRSLIQLLPTSAALRVCSVSLSLTAPFVGGFYVPYLIFFFLFCLPFIVAILLVALLFVNCPVNVPNPRSLPPCCLP